MTEHLVGIGSPAEALSLVPEDVVLHLFLLIEPEYAIVRGRCTSAAGMRAYGSSNLWFRKSNSDPRPPACSNELNYSHTSSDSCRFPRVPSRSLWCAVTEQQ